MMLDPSSSHLALKMSAIIVYFLLLVGSVAGQFRSPEITEHPSDILVPRNEPATLNCHAEGRPPPDITWFKNGNKLSTTGRHVLLTSGDLFFLRVLQTKKEEDSGVYWCQATNDIGTARSKNATLEIAVLKEVFRVTPEDTQVAVGVTALLKCVPPKGNPDPVVVWTKDGQQIDPAVQHRYKLEDQGSLAIDGVRVSDSGKYICIARNVYAKRETDAVVLTVQVPPHLVSYTAEVKGAAGTTLELVCRVGGDPPPEVYWEKLSGGELPAERMTQEEAGQVLRIRHANPEDQGMYACRAENPVGAAKANISLKVYSRPVVTVLPKDSRVALNGVATFSCEVTGSPKPTSYWTHEGRGVVLEAGQTSDAGRITVDSENTLTVHGVTALDRGYYVCTAVGIAGSAIARAHLEVMDTLDLPPPIIALGAPNQTLPVATEGEMPCEAKGTPEPKIKWFIADKPFRVSERASITPFGTLRIAPLKLSDTATYTCRATSDSGTTIWTTSLTVAKPTNPNVAFFKMPTEGALPDPPGNVVVQEINATTVKLGWRRGRPGSSSVLGFTVQLWSPDIRGPWVSATTKPTPATSMPVSVLITGLRSGTRYVFIVRASNSHGLSRPSETSRLLRTLDSTSSKQISLRQIRSRLATSAIKLLSVDAISAFSLKITWHLLVDISIIEGIYIRYRAIDKNKHHHTGPLSMETLFLKDREKAFTGHTVVGLRASTSYEVFVVPFYQTVEGQPSAAMRTRTLDAAPVLAPMGLHYSAVNRTTVRLTWDPISQETANGRIKSYHLQVLDVTQGSKVLLNVSVEGTWTLVNNLQEGSAYHATVRGVTISGAGPMSLPVAFSVSAQGAPPTMPNVPSSNVENNNYIILVIVFTAIFLFGLLFFSVFFIYRKRRNTKCPTFISKVNEKGVWSEYPRSWNDTSKSFCMTSSLYTDAGSQSGPLSQQYYQHPTIEGKEPFESRTSQICYDQRPPDNLYEDPDGLRLVSFTENNQRCFSPTPYATTTLLSSESADLLNRLPPNIPIQDLLMGSKVDQDKLETLECLQNGDGKNYATYNFNSALIKDSTRQISHAEQLNVEGEDENAKNLAMSTFNPDFASAYLLQQQQQQQQQGQVPYSYTTSSMGTLMSQGSTFGRPYVIKGNSNRGGYHSSVNFPVGDIAKIDTEQVGTFSLIDGTMTLRTRKAKQKHSLQHSNHSLHQTLDLQEQRILQDINDLFLQKSNGIRKRTSSVGKKIEKEIVEKDANETREPLLNASPRSSTFGDSEGSEEDSTTSSSNAQVIARDDPDNLFSLGNKLIWGEGDDNNISAFETKNHKRRRSKGSSNSARDSFSLAMSSPLI